jgi:threonine dehydrogenase-like Zn-dependent dehydrogenase
VLGTGWFGVVAAEAGPGRTVAVVGDGAVGLLVVLAVRQLGAERIIAMRACRALDERRAIKAMLTLGPSPDRAPARAPPVAPQA